MYRRTVLLLLIVAATTPLFASCKAYPPGPWKRDQASALRFEQAWLEVLKQKNVAALDCMLDAQFKDTSLKGVVRPKPQVLRELPLRSDRYEQELTQTNADLFGNTAVVRGVNLISDRQGHEVMRIRFTDTLYFAHGHWLAVAAQETAESPH